MATQSELARFFRLALRFHLYDAAAVDRRMSLFVLKMLPFILLLAVVGCANDAKFAELQKERIAESTGGRVTNGFDPSFIEALPARRMAILKQTEPIGADSSPAIFEKRAEYYSALTNMVQGLRSRYYFHDDFPPDLCAGLEQQAVVLTGVQYPFSGTTGCSGYDALLIQNKIDLAEDLICQMVQAIYEAGDGSLNSKDALAAYRAWLKKWKRGDSLK